jgi:hypothetical protein
MPLLVIPAKAGIQRLCFSDFIGWVGFTNPNYGAGLSQIFFVHSNE